MKSAYIYVRVSTDEQMRQGYSLIEQEARLLQHCKINNIQIEGIFREDYSAIEQDYIKSDVFFSYKHQDIIGKRHLISLFRPTSIDPSSKSFDSLDIDPSLLPILLIKQKHRLAKHKLNNLQDEQTI